VRARSPLWFAVFLVAVVYAAASGHWGSLLNLLLRVMA
jgi:hypothetical protein